MKRSLAAFLLSVLVPSGLVVTLHSQESRKDDQPAQTEPQRHPTQPDDRQALKAPDDPGNDGHGNYNPPPPPPPPKDKPDSQQKNQPKSDANPKQN